MNQYAADATWSAPPSSRSAGSGLAALVALVPLVAIATIFAVILGDGSLGLALVPAGTAAVVWTMGVLPIRKTLVILMFLGLSVDRPGDSQGLWNSWLAVIGGTLFQNLNKVLPIEGLKFNGITAAVVVLLLVRAYRVLIGRTRDTAESVVPASPFKWSLGFAVAGVVFALMFGMVTGGDSQMAKIQIQTFLVLLAVAYLFSTSLRGPSDYRLLAKVTVLAACAKALMALWVRYTLPEQVPDQFGTLREVEYATNHGDSLVFAMATIILIVPFFFRATKRHLRGLLVALPLVVAGNIANDRRIAWAQIFVGVFLLFVMNGKSWFSRRVLRQAVLLSPVLIAYVAAGWMLPSRIFKPVHTIRSMVTAERIDGTLDRSTLFRDIENYNLIVTFRGNPVLGTGWGHPFAQAVKNDDLSGFKEYFYLPHNSVLGIWAFTGAFGFMSLYMVIVVALFLAVRAHAMTDSAEIQMAVCVAVTSIATYLLHAYADIGFSEPSAIFLVGAALAVAGQAATATGAWPTSRRSMGSASV